MYQDCAVPVLAQGRRPGKEPRALHDHYRPLLADLAPPLATRPAAAAVWALSGAAVTAPAALEGRAGYDAAHLGGFAVPLPVAVRADDALPVPGRTDNRLDYEHFTVVMSRTRRLALFTAANLDGAAGVPVPRGDDAWAYDGRIPADAQAGDELYADNDFDRGHLVRREDPNWGPTAAVANRDTFHFTNCAPQLSAYNQRTWLGLEDFILDGTRRWRERASVFTGPVFRADDPVYRGVAVPLAYWKVVAFVHDDGRPSASAYVVDHDVDLSAVSLMLGPYRTFQRSVASVEALAGLSFGPLRDSDGFSNQEAAIGEPLSRIVRGPADILV